jgi:transcriptional regulator with XRE-family HTH domain
MSLVENIPHQQDGVIVDQNLQVTVRQFLRSHFKEAVKKNHRYSIRALAKQVKVSPATLSRFLNRNRDVSDETLLKIMNKFKTTFSEQSEMLIQSLQGRHLARGYGVPGSSENLQEASENGPEIVIIQDTMYLTAEQVSTINVAVKEVMSSARKNNAGSPYRLSFVLVPQGEEPQ